MSNATSHLAYLTGLAEFTSACNKLFIPLKQIHRKGLGQRQQDKSGECMWWCCNQSCITSQWAEACCTASGDTLAFLKPQRMKHLYRHISFSLVLINFTIRSWWISSNIFTTNRRQDAMCSVIAWKTVLYCWAALDILQAAAEVRTKMVSWAEIYPTPTPSKVTTFIILQGITCSITLFPAVIRLHTSFPNSLPKVGTWGMYNIYRLLNYMFLQHTAWHIFEHTVLLVVLLSKCKQL